MANLIITVIAIALVAVASLMGAYYGGSAFLNNQSAANASTVLNEGQQLTGAWQAYLNDNLNAPPTTLSALTSNNYLQTIPQAPAAPGGVASTNLYVGFTTPHYYAYADMGHPATAGSAGINDPAASGCIRVIKTAVGSTPTTILSLAPGAIASSSTMGNNTFGCAISSAKPSGGPGGQQGNSPPSGDYTAEYILQ